MKIEFPGYYRPTEQEFKNIWDTCDFLFDANVLLNLYRYTEDTRQEVISILESISDRIWIPHQAALEYHKNRIKVIKKQKDGYQEVREKLTNHLNKIQIDLEKVYKNRRHPLINCEKFINELTKYFEDYKRKLDDLESKHPDLIFDDPIKNNLTELFKDKVCDRLEPIEEKRIIKEGKGRYEKEIPPGYKDNYKGSPECYGDLILWFQIINHATKRNNPIIFITDDRKEDWWYRPYNKTIGPRPELISEIMSLANNQFYMYSVDPFMKRFGKYLGHEVDNQAIIEVEIIRENDEKLTDAFSRLVDQRVLMDSMGVSSLAAQIAKENEELMNSMRVSSLAAQIAKENEELMGSRRDNDPEKSSEDGGNSTLEKTDE